MGLHGYILEHYQQIGFFLARNQDSVLYANLANKAFNWSFF